MQKGLKKLKRQTGELKHIAKGFIEYLSSHLRKTRCPIVNILMNTITWYYCILIFHSHIHCRLVARRIAEVHSIAIPPGMPVRWEAKNGLQHCINALPEHIKDPEHDKLYVISYYVII